MALQWELRDGEATAGFWGAMRVTLLRLLAQLFSGKALGFLIFHCPGPKPFQQAFPSFHPIAQVTSFLASA